ncbi:MAG: DNA replication/repair protein RecF [Acidimicrobiia bacterium]
MRLRWLELSGFRSYPSLRFVPEQGCNLVVGENAAGKTNLLEAIGYLGSLRSFRGAPERAMIEWDASGLVVRGEVERKERQALIEVELPRDGRRRALANRKRLARAVEVLDHMRVVAFVPEDLNVIKRGPGERRLFLDGVACQLWPAAAAEQAEYERLLRHRNALLRERRSDQLGMETWEVRLARAGGRVVQRRGEAARVTVEHASALYGDLAGTHAGLSWGYRSSWGGSLADEGGQGLAARLEEALRSTRSKDLERGTTGVGPHRDEPVVLLEDRDARTSASQGEQRSLLLALRLGTARALEERMGEPPVLLLDDVFSELDAKRAAGLVDLLPPTQIFITSARAEEVPLDCRRWTVGAGAVW